MKTLTVYEFSELTEKARDKALENLRDIENNNGYAWEREALDSLTKFAEHFNAELKDYSIDWSNGSYSYAKFETSELTKKELAAKIKTMGSYDKKTLIGHGDCKFTGYGSDEDAADGARIAYMNGERDIDNILQEGFKTWLKAAQEDAAYQVSDEALEEYAEDNDISFTEKGQIIR